jgi:SAM-dependent methyltransferase
VRFRLRWLAHPLTRGLDLDDPSTTGERRRILAGKPLLRAVYREWYEALAGVLPPGPGAVLELGSGAGFLAERVPGVLTSERFWCPWTKLALDGQRLPFAAGSLRAVVMTNVLHHLPQPARFFDDAARAVRPGGVVAMVEPWSRFVYRRLHHEPFDPGAGWETAGGGPLSSANGALPWILLVRDGKRFAERHPQWAVRTVEPSMPLRYLLAGGISMRSLVPARDGRFWRALEGWLEPWRHSLGMFALVVLERTP